MAAGRFCRQTPAAAWWGKLPQRRYLQIRPSVSPRRRLYQRAVHAWGGVTGKLGENLRGIEDAIKKPPARVSYGKQSTGLFSYFPALAGAIRPWDAVPHPASFLSRKLGKELYPPTARTCASLLMSTSGSELPWARIVPRGHAPRMDSGGTPPPRHWVSPAPPGAPAESSGPSKSR